jgi:hypothetical protein
MVVSATFKNGPIAGRIIEVDVEKAPPTITLNVGSSIVEFELTGSDGTHATYSATSVTERVKTTPPPKKASRKRVGGKAVPAVKFTGGSDN